VSSTNIRDDELIQMAAFKLAETARRVAMLAKEAETPSLRRLLTASSEAINQQARDLRADAGKLEPEEPVAAAPRPRKQATSRATGQRLTLAGGRVPRLVARG
jgi:hypothetical protein